jgi:hypothetical protein
MTTNITKFVIYGERCSGTNYLENVINTNFGLELRNDFGSKHFFCFNNYNKPLDDTLFIGIIRNPIYWLNSLSRELYHIPNCNKTIKEFLTNEYYSVEENSEKIILNDLNYSNLKKYINIFEMRKMKNFYLLNIMPKKVNNYILINYESLLYNFDYTLDFIKNKFFLTCKYPIYKQIKKYKKTDKYNFVQQRIILLQPHIVNFIWDSLHIQQENRLGYFKGDNNNFFKNNSDSLFITNK